MEISHPLLQLLNHRKTPQDNLLGGISDIAWVMIKLSRIISLLKIRKNIYMEVANPLSQLKKTIKRPTIYQILGLWVLIELHLEYRWSFLSANVDFKKAFNSVDRDHYRAVYAVEGFLQGIFHCFHISLLPSIIWSETEMLSRPY